MLAPAFQSQRQRPAVCVFARVVKQDEQQLAQSRRIAQDGNILFDRSDKPHVGVFKDRFIECGNFTAQLGEIDRLQRKCSRLRVKMRHVEQFFDEPAHSLCLRINRRQPTQRLVQAGIVVGVAKQHFKVCLQDRQRSSEFVRHVGDQFLLPHARRHDRPQRPRAEKVGACDGAPNAQDARKEKQTRQLRQQLIFGTDIVQHLNPFQHAMVDDRHLQNVIS